MIFLTYSVWSTRSTYDLPGEGPAQRGGYAFGVQNSADLPVSQTLTAQADDSNREFTGAAG